MKKINTEINNKFSWFVQTNKKQNKLTELSEKTITINFVQVRCVKTIKQYRFEKSISEQYNWNIDALLFIYALIYNTRTTKDEISGN